MSITTAVGTLTLRPLKYGRGASGTLKLNGATIAIVGSQSATSWISPAP